MNVQDERLVTPLVARSLLAQRLRVRLRESVVHGESVALRGERGELQEALAVRPSGGVRDDQGVPQASQQRGLRFRPEPALGVFVAEVFQDVRGRGHLQQVHQAGIRQVGDLAGNRYRLHDTTHIRRRGGAPDCAVSFREKKKTFSTTRRTS